MSGEVFEDVVGSARGVWGQGEQDAHALLALLASVRNSDMRTSNCRLHDSPIDGISDFDMLQAAAVELAQHLAKYLVFPVPVRPKPDFKAEFDRASFDLADASCEELPVARWDLEEINDPPDHGRAACLCKILADNRDTGVLLRSKKGQYIPQYIAEDAGAIMLKPKVLPSLPSEGVRVLHEGGKRNCPWTPEPGPRVSPAGKRRRPWL